MSPEYKDLEIEMRSCLITAQTLCARDGYMNNTIREMVDMLRAKAEDIKLKLESMKE